MTIDRFTYTCALEGITYHLSVTRQGNRAVARLALRSDRGVLLATPHGNALEVILPPVRAADVLHQTNEALTTIGAPAGEWRLFLAAHDYRVGLIADQWYDLHTFTPDAARAACARLPPGGQYSIRM